MAKLAPANKNITDRLRSIGILSFLLEISEHRGAKLYVGGFIILLVSFLAVAAPIVSPNDPLKIGTTTRLTAPTLKFPFGSDQLGRDTFSRLISGARISLMVGVTSVAIAFTSGTVLGMIAGYSGGRIDDIIMRMADVMFAFPAIILALIIVSILGTSTLNVIIAISVFTTPGLARLARACTLVAKEQLYTEAARAMGATDARILRQAIFPNILAPLLVVATLQIPAAIIAEAGLSFLGLGTPIPAATWGSMLNQSRVYMQTAPWLVLAPGLAIMMTIMGFALFGDALRDVFDPRTQTRRTHIPNV